ncbi:hypothetical protein IWQ54_004494 [Labrenzia sp. EL_195]|nr:hypothetical protein [Labrenzia sp. EL_195]
MPVFGDEFMQLVPGALSRARINKREIFIEKVD